MPDIKQLDSTSDESDSNCLCCPCGLKQSLIECNDGYICANSNCLHHNEAACFTRCRDVPVLISFQKCDTICDHTFYANSCVSTDAFYVARDGITLVSRLKSLVLGRSKITVENCETFLRLIRNKKNPKVLIIGSGAQGSGAEGLWSDTGIQRIGIDIYPSSSTNYIADAHYLPFIDSSFDGVWIQAVLEHVADPSRVVSEIERVLVENGTVYAETPFMQQVHEGAYDFQRFTVVGHRYLFKHFEAIKFGGNQGPGVALAWAIRYLIWGLLKSKKLAAAISVPVTLICRFLDQFVDARSLWDGPSGVFFLGRKSDVKIPQNHLPSLYMGFQRKD